MSLIAEHVNGHYSIYVRAIQNIERLSEMRAKYTTLYLSLAVSSVIAVIGGTYFLNSEHREFRIYIVSSAFILFLCYLGAKLCEFWVQIIAYYRRFMVVRFKSLIRMEEKLNLPLELRNYTQEAVGFFNYGFAAVINEMQCQNIEEAKNKLQEVVRIVLNEKMDYSSKHRINNGKSFYVQNVPNMWKLIFGGIESRYFYEGVQKKYSETMQISGVDIQLPGAFSRVFLLVFMVNLLFLTLYLWRNVEDFYLNNIDLGYLIWDILSK